MDCKKLFAGKRITLMGLGVLGRGVGDAIFLAECGAYVLVTDRKSEGELTASITQLKEYKNISFKLGGHDLKDFTDTDMVIKAAGVRLDSKEVAAAREAGIEVAMSTALFSKYAREEGAVLVGVTGTRGKTTVTELIYHTLKKASKPALLGGNIRGLSTLSLLPQVRAGDIAVLELDSWQLQGFGDVHLSPHIAVFTNLMPDHQNYYKNMDEYFADKANIFKFQTAGDVLLVGGSILERVQAARPPQDAIVPEKISSKWKLKLLGEHNRENASLAAAACEALGLSEEEIKSGLQSFEPVEGRLQFVREVNGVKIYNDNNSTTPEATIAALRALGKNITLIIGGSEKGSPLTELVSELQNNVSHVVLLRHENYLGSARLAKELQVKSIAFEEANTLESALEAALSHTEKGTILFSPAFASFGMFKNEYDRNDTFMRLVREL